MFHFSDTSRRKLETCEKELQALFNKVIRTVDCTILCGYRGMHDQNIAFTTGRSKLVYPQSKHNWILSKAVDVAPYPIKWDDAERQYMFAGYVMATANDLGIDIRCGADWDGDFNLADQNFNDLGHFELL